MRTSQSERPTPRTCQTFPQQRYSRRTITRAGPRDGATLFAFKSANLGRTIGKSTTPTILPPVKSFERPAPLQRIPPVPIDPFLRVAQLIRASSAKPDLNASTSVSISASVIGVENVHAPELMMLQPSL